MSYYIPRRGCRRVYIAISIGKNICESICGSICESICESILETEVGEHCTIRGGGIKKVFQSIIDKSATSSERTYVRSWKFIIRFL